MYEPGNGRLFVGKPFSLHHAKCLKLLVPRSLPFEYVRVCGRFTRVGHSAAARVFHGRIKHQRPAPRQWPILVIRADDQKADGLGAFANPARRTKPRQPHDSTFGPQLCLLEQVHGSRTSWQLSRSAKSFWSRRASKHSARRTEPMAGFGSRPRPECRIQSEAHPG